MTDGDGGAIYINNFHILCERTTFQECACINQGGGLYIRENLYSYIDEIKAVIDNCTFSGNEALGGGGIYLYGTEKSIFEITKCIFNKNNAKYDGQGPESPGLNYGGGGLNFVARNVLVQNCEFSQNTGIGADISHYLKSYEPKSGVQVLDTTFFFEGNDTNPSSIYLHRANFQTKLSVLFQRCQFSGTITSEVSHFFDCDEDEYGNDKVVLTDVSFCDSNVSQAFQGNYTDYINVDKSTISYECDDTPDLPTIEPTDEFTCVSGKRCDFGQGTINNITTIKIKNSQFNDFYTEGDGGAVYLRNYFVECVHTKFIECKCTEQGGGIFIRNNLYTYSELIAVSIEFSQFKGCQAVGGAGIYVQSSMTTTMFSISSCVFDSNIIIPSATKAIVKDSEIDSTNIGGGGIYLVCPNGFVDSCEFLNNKGIGCDIAVYLPGGVAQKEGIEVKSCMFSFNGNNDNPSSFYLNRGTQFSIKVTLYNCTFAGEITGTVSHFIDCDEYDQSGPQMVLKYVSFCDSDESHAFQGTAKEYIDFDHSIIKYTCGDDFPTENPPIEPTQSSIEEPTQMIPTLPPEPPEEFSCVSGKRCDFGQGTINNITTIKIKSSQFNNFNTEGDGGAVYLRNYHVDCQTSDFFNCRCTEQGGGIFIRNSLYGYTKTVSVSIKECSFIQCQAVGGAGIYAQSSVTTTTFSISSCFFDSNQLLPPPTLPRKPLIKDSETDSTNVGGGGIYLVCPNGEVHSCNFIHNKGIGGDIAVYLPGGVAQTEGIRINSCNFDFHGEDYSPSSFYLLRGIVQSIKVSLENCIFLGEINGKISHYIDCDEFEGNGKMQLKNVSFVNSDISKAFHGNYSDYVDNDNSDFDFPIDPKTHSYTKPQTSSSVITPEHTEIFNSDFYSNNSEINPSGEIEVSVSQNIPDSENPGPDEGNKEDGLSKEATLAIAIVVPLIFVIINLVVIVILVIRKKNRRMMNDNPSNIDLSEKSVSFESQGSSQHSIPENMDVFDDNPFIREMED
ncbi:hypothetical protein TRFO_03744 [Tritrichomonas foetus]|uniref:Right handed beta helix domain-containing protein n=1 Tax=Tritrichomonas foetus TaxID=1144522 RepID=A0A1J4KLV4_9EUKA|nr:hypothetical protein TRFO_03744 [Tritrichomonas foetus]|eukprot:OHT12114.1 hypothetical protein TRFO_03744 [Tritrichomonas foetus]